MAVVKADGYGHGMLPAAPGRAGGRRPAGWVWCTWPRRWRCAHEGITEPVLCLIGVPGAAHEAAVRAGVDLSVDSVPLLAEIAAAAAAAGQPARLHLKADTGMSRGGATPAGWPGLVAAALAAQAAGTVTIAGIWSHLACADIPGHPSIDAQLASVHRGGRAGRSGGRAARGAAPGQHAGHAHPARRPGSTWSGRAARCTGCPPCRAAPRAGCGPAMTVRTRLVQAKRVPAGTPVSYGHRYITAGREHAGTGPARLRRGHPAAGVRRGRGPGARPALADRGHRVHGPVRARLRGGTGRGRGRGGAVRAGRRGRAHRPGVGGRARHGVLRGRHQTSPGCCPEITVE